MKIKGILKFYFFAESLDRAFDRLILNNACAVRIGGEESAEIILNLLEEKKVLGALWDYLDGVIRSLSEEETNYLKSYAGMRCGIGRLDGDKQRGIKRAAVKFKRRARRLESFAQALRLAGKYRCLLAQTEIT